MQPLNDLFSFLENSPGNLVYILVVAFTVLGSLQGTISQWRITKNPKARRMLLGLGVLLFVQLALFFISSMESQLTSGGVSFMPIVDRAAITISVIWMIWLWAFPEEAHGGDTESLLLSLLVIAGAVYGAISYLRSSPVPGNFNTSFQSFFWSLGSALILLLGVAVLYLRKPDNWVTGELVFVILLVGFVIDLLFPPTGGDFSGILRFFMLVSFPFLFTLPSGLSVGHVWVEVPDRASVKVVNQSLEKGADRVVPVEVDRSRYNVGTKTIQAFLSMASEVDAKKINHGITRSISQAMLVELCFVIYVSEDRNDLVFASGYDLIREENINGGRVNKDTLPMLATAVLRGRALNLPAGVAAADMKGLAEFLGLPSLGNLMCVPVASEREAYGSFLLLSPYSNRVWNADDQAFLTLVASAFVPVIERNRAMASSPAVANSADSGAQPVELSKKSDVLKQNLDQAQEEIARLKKQLEKSTSSAGNRIDAVVHAPMTSHTQVEGELRAALIEMATLQNQLAESNARLVELQNKPVAKNGSNSAEVITSISQELRQPMSSIIGYADLLLGESVGILGALQRKFIERIRTSTERIGSLVDDLIQISTLESGGLTINPEMVDVNLVIDNAMASTASQIREKNIAIKIDIPENLKPIHTDREVLQQILVHLLQNAAAASPEEGSVALKVRINNEKDGEYALLQVTDSGGGISKEDLPRVFSRLYRAENPLIQGLGDTGVGLSIAKAMTEAQGGRITVDTKIGSGSTFNVLLPMNNKINDLQGQKVSR